MATARTCSYYMRLWNSFLGGRKGTPFSLIPRFFLSLAEIKEELDKGNVNSPPPPNIAKFRGCNFSRFQFCVSMERGNLTTPLEITNRTYGKNADTAVSLCASSLLVATVTCKHAYHGFFRHLK